MVHCQNRKHLQNQSLSLRRNLEPGNYSTKLNNELNADAPVFIPTNKQNVKNKVIPNLNKAR